MIRPTDQDIRKFIDRAIAQPDNRYAEPVIAALRWVVGEGDRDAVEEWLD